MKKFLQKNKKALVFILVLIFVWRIVLFIPYFLGVFLLPQRPGFIGSSLWANFDGMHYLSIAQNGYFQYEQAFFPLYPLLMKYIALFTFGNYVWAGMGITFIALFLWLFVLYKLLQLDFADAVSRWVLVFMLFFPTGFFFEALYTESFFLFLVIAAFYAARKERWILSGLFVGLASATKLVGIFVLPAILFEWYLVYRKKGTLKNIPSLVGMIFLSSGGLLSYCMYLWNVYGDPLFFIHAQPAFGANRSGGELILLPQVFYRYIKIFLTVPFSSYDLWIALLEFTTFLIFLFLLCLGLYKRKIRVSYFIFAILAIIGPTLTGSLSSIPRYVLVAFPAFIVLGMIQNKKSKLLLIFCSVFFLMLTCMYFLRGYFIS